MFVNRAKKYVCSWIQVKIILVMPIWHKVKLIASNFSINCFEIDKPDTKIIFQVRYLN